MRRWLVRFTFKHIVETKPLKPAPLYIYYGVGYPVRIIYCHVIFNTNSPASQLYMERRIILFDDYEVEFLTGHCYTLNEIIRNRFIRYVLYVMYVVYFFMAAYSNV